MSLFLKNPACIFIILIQSLPKAKVMDPRHLSKLNELIKQTNCHKHYRCQKNNFQASCKARDIGLDTFVECNDAGAAFCKFSLFLGNGYFCTCPVRVYLAKYVEKEQPLPEINN